MPSEETRILLPQEKIQPSRQQQNKQQVASTRVHARPQVKLRGRAVVANAAVQRSACACPQPSLHFRFTACILAAAVNAFQSTVKGQSKHQKSAPKQSP